MVVRQGDIYWLDLDAPVNSEPGYQHPYVVIQSDLFNRGRLRTTVLCALTTNLKRANAPGNVLLEQGEGNLPKQSVVNVTQILTVDKSELTEKIGTLSSERVRQIFEGITLLTEPINF